jgi:hypothetical protein
MRVGKTMTTKRLNTGLRDNRNGMSLDFRRIISDGAARQSETWEQYRQQITALELDPRNPFVEEDDSRFDKVRAILTKYGGVVPPPLPQGWEGRRPVDYDGTLAGIGRWLTSELQQIAGDKIFCNGENLSLGRLNEVVRNAYRALAHLEIEVTPTRLPRATEIADAVQRIQGLAVFVRSKIKESWQSQRQEQLDRIPSGSITVARWSDVGIGIHEKGYYAFSPCPGENTQVAVCKGIPLELKGWRWRTVLECFARSADGRTATKNALVQKLGYIATEDTSRWTKSDAYEEGLTKKAHIARDKLTRTMADLARELREVVILTEKTKVTPVVFDGKGDGNCYQAAFAAARHLVRDESRNYWFGQCPA